jgi:hypothetical protein
MEQRDIFAFAIISTLPLALYFGITNGLSAAIVFWISIVLVIIWMMYDKHKKQRDYDG